MADNRWSSNDPRQVDDFESKQRSDVGGMFRYVGPPRGMLYRVRIVMDIVQANVSVGLGVVCSTKFVNGITYGAGLAVLC